MGPSHPNKSGFYFVRTVIAAAVTAFVVTVTTLLFDHFVSLDSPGLLPPRLDADRKTYEAQASESGFVLARSSTGRVRLVVNKDCSNPAVRYVATAPKGDQVVMPVRKGSCWEARLLDGDAAASLHWITLD